MCIKTLTSLRAADDLKPVWRATCTSYVLLCYFVMQVLSLKSEACVKLLRRVEKGV